MMINQIRRTAGGAMVSLLVLAGCNDIPASSEDDPASSTSATTADAEDVVPLGEAAERRAVLEVAEEFWLAFHTYGPEQLDDGTLDGYAEAVTPHLTDDFRRAFEENVSLVEDTVTQFDASSTAQILGAGASGISEDRARVIVGGSVTQSYLAEGDTVTGTPTSSWAELDLARVDGTWLVDDMAMDGASLNADADGSEVARPGDHWTSEVLAAAEEAAAVVLGYDHADLDAETERARDLLTEDYRQEYNDLRARLEPNVVDQEATVIATVAGSGLSRNATSERAEVVVLVEQQVTKQGEESSNLRQTAVFTVVLVEDRWLLDDINTD